MSKSRRSHCIGEQQASHGATRRVLAKIFPNAVIGKPAFPRETFFPARDDETL